MKPTHRYTKFREKAPQKAGTYTYTMSMWGPPGEESSWKKPSNHTKMKLKEFILYFKSACVFNFKYY